MTAEDRQTVLHVINALSLVIVWWRTSANSKGVKDLVQTTANITQVKVGEESGNIQFRQTTQTAAIQELKATLAAELAANKIELLAEISKFESGVRSTLTSAGLKWDQEYTVIPGTKPKDK